MNATVRASLIAVAAIATACWAVPALLVGAVPPDAGMFTIMALLYALLPITAVALGLLAAGSANALLVACGVGAAFAFYFPSRSRAARTSRYGIFYTPIGYVAMGLHVSMAKRCRPPR